jgi:gamma-glutamylcysteine synthetase
MTDPKITDDYTNRLLELIDRARDNGERTYGFEYELMPGQVLNSEDMDIIYDYLRSERFRGGGGLFSSCAGMGISFEPGGQIEFRSVPMTAGDEEGLRCQVDLIRSVLAGIRCETSTDYVGTGFIRNRGTAPMILSASRYVIMHDRFGHSGTRGREMMKGTASLQLHARIMSTDDILPLYMSMLRLTREEGFRMLAERADIWNRTDDTRCGLVVSDASGFDSPAEFLREFVEFTMRAVDMETGLPWEQLRGTSFQDFLDHMTTIFTDIRLNMKGVTWELRTPDSLPLEDFPAIWNRFVAAVEDFMRDWQSRNSVV